MAWYQDGDWNDLRVDRTGHLLHQMCYAINEREDAVGRTKTTWGSGRGSLPAAYKFDGIRLDRRCEIIDMMRDAIPSLINTGYSQRFVKRDGTDWTETSLLEAAGYGDEWIAQDGLLVEDLDPYLQMRAVLEALVYVRKLIGSKSPTGTNIRSVVIYIVGASRQYSYDQAIASFYTNTSFSTTLRAWQQVDSGSPSSRCATDLRVHFQGQLGPFTDKPVSVPISIVESYRQYVTAMDALNFVINGTTITSNASGTGSQTHNYTLGDTMDLGDTTFDGTYWWTKIEGDWAYPATNPFKGFTSSDSLQYREVVVQALNASAYYVAEVLNFTYG